MRLFVGIQLSEAVIRELSTVADRFKTGDDGLRWSAPESWHITLQFLGNTIPAKFECVAGQLRDVHAAPVPVKLGQLDFFDRAGVFFADVALTPELIALQRLVVAANKGCGFAPESRPYHPHITLARIKERGRGGDGHRGETRGGNGLLRLKDRIGQQSRFTEFTADEFVLYESMPERNGTRYEVRERFSLNQ